MFNVEVKESQELKMAARFSGLQTTWTCPQKRGVVIKQQVSGGEGGIELGNNRQWYQPHTFPRGLIATRGRDHHHTCIGPVGTGGLAGTFSLPVRERRAESWMTCLGKHRHLLVEPGQGPMSPASLLEGLVVSGNTWDIKACSHASSSGEGLLTVRMQTVSPCGDRAPFASHQVPSAPFAHDYGNFVRQVVA